MGINAMKAWYNSYAIKQGDGFHLLNLHAGQPRGNCCLSSLHHKMEQKVLMLATKAPLKGSYKTC